MSRLIVDSVIKQFDTRQILSDIFLDCAQGEIIGLLGRNGSGKSTLLKIISGSLRADNKFIKIDNKKINNLYQARKLIHYLPQDNFLPNHVRLETLIKLNNKKEDVKKVLSNYLIKDFIHKKINQLAGGEKRLVEILIAIYSESKFVLIDEPFNGVAPIYKEEIKKLVKEESTNKAFILTDHDYRNILDLSTKIYLLHDGGLRHISDKAELQEWNYIPY